MKTLPSNSRLINLHLPALVLLFHFPQTSLADSCGSLVTYRQYTDLLHDAPKCLINGCNNPSGISSPCPRSAPCGLFWNLYVPQFQQNWCSTCHSSDVACRIHGWPIGNITTVCESSPNALLFGGEQCCTNDDEPFQLANFTGTLCNGSAWRTPFDPYGGMARLDWREWIMPWNWTVRNANLPPEEQHCTRPSRYLAVYVVEHFFWLFFAFGVGFVRLRITRWEEKRDRAVLRYLLLSVATGFRKVFKVRRNQANPQTLYTASNEALRPGTTDGLRWGFPVFMGVFQAGLQLSFNFIAAHLIKDTPGYHDVPLGLLALLFCCRPRLSWFVCALSQLTDNQLCKIFKFKERGDGLWAARLVLSSSAVTSAVTEAIMQLLGSYFLGRTANIGRQRGFYKVHALRPKYRGKDARHMYLGGLFWVMLIIPVFIGWLLVAMYFGYVQDTIASWRRGIYNFLNPRRQQKIPELVRGRVIWLLDLINPDPPGQANPPGPVVQIRGGDETSSQLFRRDPAHPHPDPENQPMLRNPSLGGGPGSEYHDSDTQPLHVTRTRPASTIPSELDEQVMMPTRRSASGSAGYAQNLGPTQRRTPSGTQYGALPEHDSDDEDSDLDPQPMLLLNPRETQPGPSHSNRNPAHSSTSQRLPTTPGPSRANPPVPVPEMREIHHGSDSHRSLLSSSPTATYAPTPSPAPSPSPISAPALQAGPGTPDSEEQRRRQRHEYSKEVSWEWKDWEGKIIWAGILLGILSYAAQWLFWDGFVKAAGDRFCPPKVVKVGALWSGGAALYVGAPLLGF